MLIDARGKACPMPVVLTKKALDAGEKEVTVRVDNAVAVENLKRLAASLQLQSEAQEESDGFSVFISGDAACDCVLMDIPTAKPQGATLTLFIGKDHIGDGDETLGKNLMKMYFLTLSEGDIVPAHILFMNGGVLLPTQNEQVVEALQKLQDRGSEILVCGTCLSAFGIADQLKIGTVSNMYEIQKRMLEADKVISFE